MTFICCLNFNIGGGLSGTGAIMEHGGAILKRV